MDTTNNFTTTEQKVNFYYPNSAWLTFIKHIPWGVSPDLLSGFSWYLWIYVQPLHMQFALHKTNTKTAEKAKPHWYCWKRYPSLELLQAQHQAVLAVQKQKIELLI